MLVPRRICVRRRARNHKEYLIGSTEFIENVYDKLIKDAELRSDKEAVKLFKDCKKEALKRQNKKIKAKMIELD